jgi:hypothetical protein
LKKLIGLIELGFVDFDEIRMNKFFHDFDFLEGLLDFKGIDMDFLESITTILDIFDQVYGSEASFSDKVNHFVFGVHTILAVDVLDMRG